MSRLIFCVVAVILLAACATADVKTTVDPEANLSKFHDFVFLENTPAAAAGAITDPMVRRRIEGLIAQQLAGRGYRMAPSAREADLGVYYAGRVEPRQRALVVGRPGPYDYSWGRTELGGESTMDYREGTLFVDIVDLGSNKLMWRTRISEVFSAGYSEENWKKLDRALDEAFKNLPSRR